MNVPDWLKQRGCSLVESTDGYTWFVVVGGKPQYRLRPVPVDGKHGCSITQTNNGRRLPSDSKADTAEAAIQAGLQDLGKYLGWVE